jgi:putative membrane protein
LRTNAGYERWWEGRKRWGGIVNQCRNLAIQALSYGPEDPGWRRRFVRCTAAFAHAARRSLRDERSLPELVPLHGPEKTQEISESAHIPSAVALEIGHLLREGRSRGMDQFAFARAEEERSKLIEHIGACERILRTPLPEAYSIEIRQFIFVFLFALPFGILLKVDWLTPVVTMMVAFPILALDEIGVELQNPFSTARLNHLPLDTICQNLEHTLLAMLPEPDHPGRRDSQQPEGRSASPESAPRRASQAPEDSPAGGRTVL